MKSLTILTLVLIQRISEIECDNFDVLIDAKATSLHRVDSLNLLIYCECHRAVSRGEKFHVITKTFSVVLTGSLLALTVLTIWIFKFRRVSWLNETGLAVIYGETKFLA